MFQGLSKSTVDETIELMNGLYIRWTQTSEQVMAERIASILLVNALREQRQPESQVFKPVLSGKDKEVAQLVLAHFNHHVDNNMKLVRPDERCCICRVRLNNDRKKHGEWHYRDNPVLYAKEVITKLKGGKLRSSKALPEIAREEFNSIVNELNGEVCVIVPRKWIGKKVRISLVESIKPET